MSSKITLANGKQFDAIEGKSILESARLSGLVLEYGCSNGQCGVCACTLISGEVNNLNDSFHSPEEKNLNRILTCQSIPISDVIIDIADLGIYENYPAKTMPARISSIEKIGKGILKLTLRTPPTSKLNFLPGQFLDLIHGSLRRSYSIANAQRSDGSFDLIIKKVEGEKMSEILFNQTKENDLFRVEGPLGTFGWREDIKKNVIFMVTGTGIAPALSMFSVIKGNEESILLIWVNRFVSEFFEIYLPKNVTIKKVLSREDKKYFYRGYVQDVLLSSEIDLSDVTVFACGSESMIRDSKEKLVKHGLENRHFYSDAYVSSGKQL